MTTNVDDLKTAYATMIVDGMDMDLLITFAIESIEKNLQNYDMADLKEEICDCYGEETWADMNSWSTVHHSPTRHQNRVF